MMDMEIYKIKKRPQADFENVVTFIVKKKKSGAKIHKAAAEDLCF